MSDLLSQAEIDALLSGMNGGGDDNITDLYEDENDDMSQYLEPTSNNSNTTPTIERGVVREYDLSSQERIVRGRMPTLEMVNERFARLLRTSFFQLLRRSSEIYVSPIKIQKFSEFTQNLLVPTNLSIIKAHPLRGKALVVMNPALIFTVVDNFFGGGGGFHTQSEGKEFTPVEMRIVRIILDMIFKDLKEAWKPAIDLEFEYLSSEINPRFANIVEAGEMVVVATVHVDLEGGGGDIHVTMPYTMLEPIRELLDVINISADEVDQNWHSLLLNEVMRVELDINSFLVEKTMSIRDVLQLKKGDVIPVEMPENVKIRAAGIPIFEGKMGIYDGNYAVQIINKIINK